MFKRFAFALAAIGMALSVFSCSKDALVQKPLKEDIRGISSLDKVVLYHTKSSTKLAFTADVDWKIVNCPSWLTISGADKDLHGKIGTTILTLSAGPNLTRSELSADLLFIELGEDGKQLSKLNVSQPAVIFDLDVDGRELHYGWSDHKLTAESLQGDKTIKVTSNIYWKILEQDLSGNPSNLFTYTKPDGENTSELQVVPTNVNFDKDKTVEAYLVPMQKVDGRLEEIIGKGIDRIKFTLSQEYLLFHASWKEGTKIEIENFPKDTMAMFSEVGPGGDRSTSVLYDQILADVNVRSRSKWVMTGCPDWIEVYDGNKKLEICTDPKTTDPSQCIDPDPNGINLTVKVLSANPSGEERRGTIDIAPYDKDAYDKDGKFISKSIQVKQPRFIFDIYDAKYIKGNASPVDAPSQDGFSFANDDPQDQDPSGKSYNDDEQYVVYFEVSGTDNNIDKIAVPSDLSSWLQCGEPVLITNGHGTDRSKYSVTFSLKAQNLEFNSINDGYVATPVIIQQKQSLLQSFESHTLLKQLFLSQKAFVFDLPYNDAVKEQNSGNQTYKLYELPPALTAQKLNSRAGFTLFKLEDTNMTGNWQIDSPVDWIGVYLDAQMVNWGTNNWDYTKNVLSGAKGNKIDFYFAPVTANPDKQENNRSAQLKIVSAKHLAKYGSFNSVPDKAKRVYDITQSKYGYQIYPKGKQTDQAAFDDVPAYSSSFNNSDILENAVTLKIICDGEWRLDSYPDFLIPVSTKLNGNGELENDGQFELVFNLKSNLTYNIKNQDFVVTCTDIPNGTKRSNLKQEAFVFDLKSRNYSLTNIPAYLQPGDNKEFSFSLTEGAKFTVTDSWTGFLSTLSDQSGAGKSRLTNLFFHPNTNVSLDNSRDYKAVVTVTKPQGLESSSAEISFVQNKYLFDVSQKTDVEFSELYNRQTTFTVTSSGPWTISGSNWYTVSPNSGIGSESPVTITVNAQENHDTNTRDNVSEIVATQLPASTQKRTVKINQDAYKWDVIDESGNSFTHVFEPLEVKDITIKVKSSGPWSVSSVPSWVEVITPNGKNNEGGGNGNEDGSYQTVTLRSKKNLETDANKTKQTSFSITANKNTALNQNVSVMQKPFIWEVVGADAMAWDSPLSTDTKQFTVKSSGEWIITQNGDTVSEATGFSTDHWTWNWASGSTAGDGSAVRTISIHPAINDSFKDVANAFYLVSKEHKDGGRESDCKVKINCTQPRYVLEIGEDMSFGPWNSENETVNQVNTRTITCTTDNWKPVVSGADWIHASKVDGKLRIEVDNYNGDVARNPGNVMIQSTDAGINLFRTLTVNQSAFVFQLKNASDASHNLSTLGDSRTVGVDCSVSYDVYDKEHLPAFLKDKWSIDSNKNLNFTVDMNTAPVPNDYTMVLESHGRTIPIDLHQYPYLFSISGTETIPEAFSPLASHDNVKLTVKSNVPWSIDIPEGWMKPVNSVLTDTPVNGDSDKSYDIYLQPKNDNKSALIKSGNIVVSNSVMGVVKDISVMQDGFNFDPASYTFKTTSKKDNEEYLPVISSSKPWDFTVTKGGDWLSASKASPTQLGITAANNMTALKRDGTVLVICPSHPEVSRTISLSQNPLLFTVTVDGGVENGGTKYLSPLRDNSIFGITVKSNVPWELSSFPYGMSLLDGPSSGNPANDEAGQEYKLTVAPNGDNQSTSNFTGTIALKNALVNDAFSFNFVQEGFENGELALQYGTVGSDQETSFAASGAWEAKITQTGSWLSLNKYSGSGGEKVKLTVTSQTNLDPNGREGTVKIWSKAYPDVSRTITVNQYPYLFSVEGISNGGTKSLSPLSDLSEFTLTINSNVDWNIKEALPSWLAWNGAKIGKPVNSGTATKYEVKVKAKADNATSTANPLETIAFENAVSANPFSFNVKQEGFQTGTAQLNYGTGGAVDIPTQFEASAAWMAEVSDDAKDWITLDAEEGNGGGTVTLKVTAKKNTTPNTRTGTVRMSLKDHEEAVRTVNVSQLPYLFSVEGVSDGATRYMSPRAFNTYLKLVVTSNVKWDMKDLPDWLELSGPTGMDPLNTDSPGGVELLLHAKSDNESSKQNTATIAFDNAIMGDSVHSFTLIQDGFRFSDRGALNFDSYVQSGKSISFNATCPWEATPQGNSWLSISPSSGNGVSNEANAMTVSAQNHYSIDSDRSGVIMVSTTRADYNPVSWFIDVTQNKATFSVDPSTSEPLSFDVAGETKTVKISCSVPCRLVFPSWITCNGHSSPVQINPGENVPVSVTAGANGSTSAKSGTLRIESPDGVVVYGSYTLTQPGKPAE